ncbi:MAG: rhomboid family intramembrane serine protease [Proteobacteria bacterium]|nr:MAG: rhomboid family intramembrane serine protease [Pseudomonadota bacterium]
MAAPMLRLPFLTITVAFLLIAIYAVTGSRASAIRADLAKVHARFGLEEKISIVLAQACARENAADPTCLHQGARAASLIVGSSPNLILKPGEAKLVQEFARAPSSIYELPGYPAYRRAWAEESAALARFSADEGILLGRHWRWPSAFWALWEHGSLAHLVFNLVNLILFGSLVEWMAGKRAWILGYFGSGFAATAFYAAFFQSDLVATLGPSPAIYGLMGLYLIYFFEDWPALAEENLRRKILYGGAAVYVVFDLAAQSLLGSAELLPLHLGGFAVGITLGVAFRALELGRPETISPAYGYVSHEDFEKSA